MASNKAEKFMGPLDKRLDNNSDEKPVDSPANSQENKPVFSIPNKAKDRTNTKSFNVVMDSTLVDKMDKLAKRKGYSRNQLINYMCNWCIENMKD